MNVVAEIAGFGTSLGGYIVPFLFVLTVVVFFHELGHFLVARWCGVKVDTFSIGFGREIFGRVDRYGTRWKVSWIPLGGYVKFAGDENAASVPDVDKLSHIPPEQREGLFFFKPLYQRAAVVAAGPIANFILAIAIFAIVFAVVGKGITPAVVGSVVSGSPADAAGFKVGDVVEAIDGAKVSGFEDMVRIVSINPGVSMKFDVSRNGQMLQLVVAPRVVEVKDALGNTLKVGQIGIGSRTDEGSYIIKRMSPLESVVEAARKTWFVVTSSLHGIGGILTGQQEASQIGGPLSIAEVSGQVAAHGFAALLNLTAVLSVSIGLLNLFPVPMLDGGHLLYYAIEAVQGHPLGQKAQEFGFRIGLVLVMMLMFFATWNDLVRLFT